jgi:hypothetical protein
MIEPVRFELTSPVLPRSGEASIEDPRGWAGDIYFYGTPDNGVEARLVVLAKLPRLPLDEHRGIMATGDRDAAAFAINNLFDAAISRSPRPQWKAHQDHYFDDHLGFDTWEPSMIEANGTGQSAFSLHYADAAVHVADTGEVYLIVVTVPAVETPSVRQVLSSDPGIVAPL